MPKVEVSTTLQRFLLYAVVVNLVFTVFSFTWSSLNKDKTAYVDAISLVSKYQGMTDARKKLTDKTNAWKANLDSLRLETERTIATYELTQAKISEREKALLEELIKSKQQQYVSYEQSVKDLYQKSDQELSAEILKKVNDYIKRYGEKNGYTIIFASTHYGNIAYAQDVLNITDEVLKGLNQEYQSLN